MPDLESALAALQARIAETQKASDALAKALKSLRSAADSGHIANLDKGLAVIAERGGEAEVAARSLANAWSFDAREHLAQGYFEELREEAGAQGIKLFEKDGRLYAFPLLLKVDVRDASVKIGKKIERRLRPRHLVKLLAELQQRPQRFREDRFLSLLYEVYGQIAGTEGRKGERGPGSAVSLSQIHGLMTLLPGTDYPIEEFGRDLLLLDRKPDLRTKDGATFEFPRSTSSKRMKPINVYDENGNERSYVAIRFVRPD